MHENAEILVENLMVIPLYQGLKAFLILSLTHPMPVVFPDTQPSRLWTRYLTKEWRLVLHTARQAAEKLTYVLQCITFFL